MTSIDDLKKKAKDALDTIADVSVEAYKLAEEKAKIIARWTKLNTEISREKSQIRKLKADIGHIYYQQHKDSPEESLREQCEGITEAHCRILEKQKELEDLKNTNEVDEEDFVVYEEEADDEGRREDCADA